MYTQCPHCQTCFRIAEAHLKVANGKVRCGSCQEVFDATQHLFRNLTDREPITDFKLSAPPPAPPTPPANQTPPRPTAKKPVNPPRPSAPPEQKQMDIRRERAEAPDQGKFMESVIGNDRYNDLDQMGSINIPGDIDFGDSIIKFADKEKKKEPPARQVSRDEERTPYEDLESKEAAATTADHDSINDFYAQVDAQLGENEQDAGRSQLDKDIDELLAFAKGLDNDDKQTGVEQTKPTASSNQRADNALEEEFDLQAIADFEKELETTSSDEFASQDLDEEPFSNQEHTASKAVTADKPAEAKSAPEMDNELPSTSEAVSDHPVEQATSDEMPSPAEDIPLALRRSLDSLSQTQRRSLGQTLLLLLVILVLICGLGIQVVLFRNVELAHKFPALIPELNKVCSQLPCRYSGKVDVSQIKLLSRDVRSHPTQPNALLISAAFVNEAPFDQPYPNIQITLYDLGGNVVASRRFTPQEYLEQMYNRFLLMESGTPVHVTLAVLDPGKDAINFEFSFQ